MNQLNQLEASTGPSRAWAGCHRGGGLAAAPGETSPQQLSIAADSPAWPPVPRAKKDTAAYSRSDEMPVINQRGGEMETVSFQISNSVAEITGLPKDEESPAFQIRLMLDIRSCRLKKWRGFDGCLTMI